MAEQDTMNQEMTGMAAPTEAPLTDAPAAEEPSSSLSATTMMTNYESMEPQKQEAIKTLLNDPISQLFDELTGMSVMSEFASQLGSPETPATPAPEGEGMMAPTEAPAPLA